MVEDSILRRLLAIEEELERTQVRPLSFEARTKAGWRLQNEACKPGEYPSSDPYEGFMESPGGYSGWGMYAAGVMLDGSIGNPIIIWQRWVIPVPKEG